MRLCAICWLNILVLHRWLCHSDIATFFYMWTRSVELNQLTFGFLRRLFTETIKRHISARLDLFVLLLHFHRTHVFHVSLVEDQRGVTLIALLLQSPAISKEKWTCGLLRFPMIGWQIKFTSTDSLACNLWPTFAALNAVRQAETRTEKLLIIFIIYFHHVPHHQTACKAKLGAKFSFSGKSIFIYTSSDESWMLKYNTYEALQFKCKI